MDIELDKPIAIAVLLFIILILAFYLVYPKYQVFQQLLTKLAEKEAEFQGKDSYFIEITRTYKELMENQESLQKIESALPTEFSAAPLVNFIYKKSAENGVIVQGINIAGTSSLSTKEDVKETAISLNLIGSYLSFKNFLSSIEKSARLIEAENFSFSVQPPSLQNPQIPSSYPINLVIKVYSY